QTTDQDRVPVGAPAASRSVPEVDISYGWCSVDVGSMLVVWRGQLRQIRKDQVGYVSPQLRTRCRIKGVQHAIIGALIHHCSTHMDAVAKQRVTGVRVIAYAASHRHRLGIDNVAEDIRAETVAVRLLRIPVAAQKVERLLTVGQGGRGGNSRQLRLLG